MSVAVGTASRRAAAPGRPVVFVSVPHGSSAGNMLRTGLVRRILEANRDAEITLVSPLVEDPGFVHEFQHPRVRFEPLPPHRVAGFEARLMSLIQASYLDSGLTEAVRIRRQEAVAKKTIRFIRAKRLLASVVAPSIVRKESRYDLVDRFVSHPLAEQLFNRYRPTLLVVSSPGLILAEVPLLRTAARSGVPSVAVDASWDNFTNKVLPVRRVDRLVVWNTLMKQQAAELHGYRPEQVRVTGTPHWDLYFRGHGSARDVFLRRIGADPSRKLITLTTTPLELYPHYDHVLRVLIGAMQDRRWPSPCQILVRVHPRDSLERYRQFVEVPHVMVEKPFRTTVKASDGLSADITPESQQHLADTLRHSDVVLQVASTIAIEAAIFDTPVVNISFDGEEPCEFVRSARRYLQFTHFANVVRHDAMRLATTPAELVEAVAEYLRNPAMHADGRRRLVAEQCEFVDGRSSERVAACVVDMLDHECGLQTRPLTAVASS
jgi:CDP-glycerol:poly(glycerophosphate) glycerophosphotransferase